MSTATQKHSPAPSPYFFLIFSYPSLFSHPHPYTFTPPLRSSSPTPPLPLYLYHTLPRFSTNPSSLLHYMSLASSTYFYLYLRVHSYVTTVKEKKIKRREIEGRGRKDEAARQRTGRRKTRHGHRKDSTVFVSVAFLRVLCVRVCVSVCDGTKFLTCEENTPSHSKVVDETRRLRLSGG